VGRVKIVLDKAGLRTDANAYSLPVVRKATRTVLNRSAVFCPVDTGNLRAGGRMKMVMRSRGPTGIVEYIAKYAAAVEGGSAPHIIKARKKKALRFVVDGQTIFAKSVRHPGTRPRPFLSKAAQLVAAANGWRFVRKR
jgi:hypothetical protein